MPIRWTPTAAPDPVLDAVPRRTDPPREAGPHGSDASGQAGGPPGAGAPGASLSPDFAARVRAVQAGLTTEIIQEIRHRIPEYDRPLTGRFGSGVQLGVRTALAEFAALIGDGALPAEQAAVYQSLGRGELIEGRSLDALQAAYRLGARVAWRRYAGIARGLGMDPEQMITLAEAVFAHIDRIAAASVAGYVQAEADAVSSLHRRRRYLLELLISGAEPDEVARAADEAHWPLPEQVACAVLTRPATDRRDSRATAPPPASLLASTSSRAPALAVAPVERSRGGCGGSPPRHDPAALPRVPRWPAQALADLDRPDPFVLLPHPAGLLADPQAQQALRNWSAVIGPTVPLAWAAQSLRWARRLRDAAPGNTDGSTATAPDGDLPHADDRLADLLLLADQPLVRLIGGHRLAPLSGMTVKQRQRMESTLLAWLAIGRGSAAEVAARLGVHPQTARQRIRRVQALFGEVLADPQARFELEVALRGRALARTTRPADHTTPVRRSQPNPAVPDRTPPPGG